MAPSTKCNVRDETPFRKWTRDNNAPHDDGRFAPAVIARVGSGIAVVVLSAVAAAIIPVISRRAARGWRWIAGAVDRSGSDCIGGPAYRAGSGADCPANDRADRTRR